MAHIITTHDVAGVVRTLASDPIALATATAWTGIGGDPDHSAVTVITAIGVVHVVGE